ncbi:hypothetical protein STRCI_004717 [Streptomyces cinnabarinus]|uniref:TPM domain-containing protein n=1 Tax=Streptomyces cinnabarinus TaxID=67287 RepID=A0ABY7KH48_9ACTN|nr:hypothetical protein [Streptomyces cinnabarinus]WAZ23378.1 hypothetical protein STRCI_004717 [Streptomyces cinnabarinus]
MRGFLVLGVLTALFTPFAAATPAGAAEDDTQAAYLAARLRENPVYVTDQLPREVPKSMTADFARVAKRTGVPTYVLVLPRQATYPQGLLGAVHDRLGEDGLFVVVDESSVTEAVAFGVSAPAEDALTVCLYELPYDAGPLREFEVFAEVIAQGGGKAAARADAARDKYADDEPAAMYIGSSDRENQSTLTGVLVTAVPLLILLLVPGVRRWRRKLRGGPARGKSADRRLPRWVTPAVALAAAVAIPFAAAAAFDQTTSSPSPRPRAIDLEARLDRVAEGLAEDPVYTDPESPRVLSTAQLTSLHGRIENFERSEGGGPVYVSVVPQLFEDESEGDEENFAYALHDKLGEDGVYIVADPLHGYIKVFNHGLRLDGLALLFDLPDSIAYGDDKADEAEDHLLGERLDALMTFLDKSPRTDEPETPGDPYPVTNPVTEDDLPSLFSSDFWPGLFLGLLAAGLLYGVLAGVLAVIGAVLRRRRPEPLSTESLPQTSPTEPALSYLRTTARIELRTLKADFESGEPGPTPGRTDSRPGDCLDAALLLLEGDPDRIDAADAATLVAVTVLARAGRAALAGKAYNRCCAVNPLHGPAVTRHHARVVAEGRQRRLLHVCGLCRDMAIAAPATLHTRVLTLPGSSPRARYEDAELLSVIPEGIRRLIEKAKETAHVA